MRLQISLLVEFAQFFSCKVKAMIFIDVTLKFRYKPIISNDFID